MQSSGIKKRSIKIAMHKTSISLEDEFWDSLREIAKGSGEPVSQLISDINKGRQSANLSSAIRSFVLRHYRDQINQQKDETSVRSQLVNSIKYVAH
jgi:predicted DNA-binding ribbon-helix-helix protein